MTEQNTEPIEDVTEPPEVVSPIEEPPEVPNKSRKARSELQLKALAAARQKAFIVRAEGAKAKNESKNTPEASIQFQKSYPDVSKDDSKDVSKDDLAKIPDDSKDVLPENENVKT